MVLSYISHMFHALYRFHYGLGLHAMRLSGRMDRFWGRLTAPVRFWCRYMWKRYAVLPAHRFRRKWRVFFGQIGPALRFLGRTARENPRRLMPTFFHLCGSAVAHHRETWFSLGRLLGPVATAVLLAVTISSWVNSDYCLSVTYDDINLGIIENAAVYDAGAALAQDRVINADNSFSVKEVPVFSMTLQNDRTPMNEDEMCDAILSTAGDSIVEATGLYVDGKFIGAMETRKALDKVLDGLKEGQYNKKDKNQRAEFIQTVKKTDGLFPATAVKSADEIHALLTKQTVVEKIYLVQPGDTLSTIAVANDLTTSELRNLNPTYMTTDDIQIGAKLVVQRPQPFLQVKVVKTVKYKETIDYKTKTVYRDDKNTTYQRVTTAGREGSQNIVAEDTYIDGIKTTRRIIKRTVTRQPVTKVVEQGTKKVYNSGGDVIQQGDGIVHGNMTWPVPICRNVYQGYHRGHLAIDISSGPIPVFNKPCLAADGGTVEYAGWYYGYGRYVKIRHANGLVTTYGHLNTINVVSGQKVSRGQMIGRVGNSGYSFGPHLHFEVIKNGVKVNPLNYVRP